jgi:signal transduction histidine kinase
VKICVKLVEDQFSIAVNDTGPGDRAWRSRKRFFGEFQQIDNSSTRKKGGTGLGLSISRKLVNLHGGRIDLDSTIGVGSTFSIVLPVRVNQQRQAA